jgi:ABC-2 type transport system permease protein
MKKILVIIKREYLSRVKKKSFLVTTLVLPVLLSGLMAVMVYVTNKSERKQTIGIVDDTGLFVNKFDTSHKTYLIKYLSEKVQHNEGEIAKKNNCDLLVHISPLKNNAMDSVALFTEQSVGMTLKYYVENQLNTVFRQKMMMEAGISQQEIDSIRNMDVKLSSQTFDNKKTNTEVASALGYGMGFLMYIIIFIYGAGVMRGVMEEKTNRIAEVMVSSVKPFHLMLGKIIGIGFVGLTQFLLWLIVGIILQTVLFSVFGLSGSSTSTTEITNAMKQMPASEMQSFFNSIMTQNWALIIPSFLFYFLGGYFIYAALFAAVGSMVNEDPQEAQQIMMPIMLPIIFGMIIMSSTMKDPNSPLSVFGSLFPLTSPIVMLARIPFGVPAWQLITSILLLIGGFVLFTWLSAKIYRTGILMYGKKLSWKEAIKWIVKS